MALEEASRKPRGPSRKPRGSLEEGLDPRGRLEERLEEGSRNISEEHRASRKRRGMQKALEEASRSLEELSSLRDKGTNPQGDINSEVFLRFGDFLGD